MTPKSDFVVMKKFDEQKRRWTAVICRVESDEFGNDKIVVYDADHAPTEAALDDWVERALRERPWGTTEDPL